MSGRDRFGIAWRPELGAGLLSHPEQVDVTEIMLEHVGRAQPRQQRAFETLCAQLPAWIHGTTLGVAGASGLADAAVERCARVVNRMQPAGWSEHLAFVRAAGVEIGHLAAPPRTPASVEMTAGSLRRVAGVVGAMPLVENVATMMVPAGSTLTEPEWLRGVLELSGAELLLDLHNLYSNAVNEGEDATSRLLALPLERVRQVHIAGGRWVGPRGRERRLDDHLHPTPREVFDLLEILAAHHAQPLTVIVERDGPQPPVGELLGEVALARQAVARGRMCAPLHAREAPALAAVETWLVAATPAARQQQAALESLLARSFVDRNALEQLLADPRSAALSAGLEPEQAEALLALDDTGMRLAFQSFQRKRSPHGRGGASAPAAVWSTGEGRAPPPTGSFVKIGAGEDRLNPLTQAPASADHSGSSRRFRQVTTVASRGEDPERY